MLDMTMCMSAQTHL